MKLLSISLHLHTCISGNQTETKCPPRSHLTFNQVELRVHGSWEKFEYHSTIWPLDQYQWNWGFLNPFIAQRTALENCNVIDDEMISTKIWQLGNGRMNAWMKKTKECVIWPIFSWTFCINLVDSNPETRFCRSFQFFWRNISLMAYWSWSWAKSKFKPIHVSTTYAF